MLLQKNCCSKIINIAIFEQKLFYTESRVIFNSTPLSMVTQGGGGCCEYDGQEMARPLRLTFSVCRVFQHDLYQLRLNTARSYVAALETSASPVSSDPEEPLKLTVQVPIY